MKVSIIYAFTCLFLFNTALAQKKEKLKGSKNVIITSQELTSFENIEVDADYEIVLTKRDNPSIEIEADNNLHEAINFQVSGKTLKISELKEFTGAKKFLVKINYADELKLITAKKQCNINCVSEINTDEITVKVFDNAKTNLKIKSTNAFIMLNDKSRSELTIKADSLDCELNNNAQLKGILNTPALKIDLRQNSGALLEGNVKYAVLKLINNASVSSKKLSINKLNIITESGSKCSANVSDLVNISASGKSEIELLGNAQIVMKQFSNTAALLKKEK